MWIDESIWLCIKIINEYKVIEPTTLSASIHNILLDQIKNEIFLSFERGGKNDKDILRYDHKVYSWQNDTSSERVYHDRVDNLDEWVREMSEWHNWHVASTQWYHSEGGRIIGIGGD